MKFRSKQFRVFLVLLCVLINCVPAFPRSQNEYEEYAGIGVGFPYYWEKKVASDTVIYYYPSYVYEETGKKNGLIQFGKIEDDIAEEDKELFLYSYKKGTETGDNKRKIKGITRIEINGIEAERMSFEQIINTDYFDGEDVVIINNGHALSVSYIQRRLSDLDLKQDYEAVIESICYAENIPGETSESNNQLSLEFETQDAEEAEEHSDADQIDDTSNYEPTAGEKNALGTAKKYLSIMAFSKQGLKDQLEYEGFSDSEADYAVNNVEADWNEQAFKSAQKYLELMEFSLSGLIDQLVYDGFTQEEAEYGANKAYN